MLRKRLKFFIRLSKKIHRKLFSPVDSHHEQHGKVFIGIRPDFLIQLKQYFLSSCAFRNPFSIYSLFTNCFSYFLFFSSVHHKWSDKLPQPSLFNLRRNNSEGNLSRWCIQFVLIELSLCHAIKIIKVKH